MKYLKCNAFSSILNTILKTIFYQSSKFSIINLHEICGPLMIKDHVEISEQLYPNKFTNFRNKYTHTFAYFMQPSMEIWIAQLKKKKYTHYSFFPFKCFEFISRIEKKSLAYENKISFFHLILLIFFIFTYHELTFIRIIERNIWRSDETKHTKYFVQNTSG